MTISYISNSSEVITIRLCALEIHMVRKVSCALLKTDVGRTLWNRCSAASTNSESGLGTGVLRGLGSRVLSMCSSSSSSGSL